LLVGNYFHTPSAAQSSHREFLEGLPLIRVKLTMIN
jgi:hypothetical protein